MDLPHYSVSVSHSISPRLVVPLFPLRRYMISDSPEVHNTYSVLYHISIFRARNTLTTLSPLVALQKGDRPSLLALSDPKRRQTHPKTRSKPVTRQRNC